MWISPIYSCEWGRGRSYAGTCGCLHVIARWAMDCERSGLDEQTVWVQGRLHMNDPEKLSVSCCFQRGCLLQLIAENLRRFLHMITQPHSQVWVAPNICVVGEQFHLYDIAVGIISLVIALFFVVVVVHESHCFWKASIKSLIFLQCMKQIFHPDDLWKFLVFTISRMSGAPYKPVDKSVSVHSNVCS